MMSIIRVMMLVYIKQGTEGVELCRVSRRLDGSGVDVSLHLQS
jgi:hypothetical protein